VQFADPDVAETDWIVAMILQADLHVAMLGIGRAPSECRRADQFLVVLHKDVIVENRDPSGHDHFAVRTQKRLALRRVDKLVN
jgi:hypothetical protein